MDESFPFEADVRAAVMEALPHDDRDTSELEALSASELLIRLWNWHSRLVVPRPRQVHWSRELLTNPLRSDERFGPAIDDIVRRLEAGVSVGRYLTKSVGVGFVGLKAAAGLGARRDLDLMLSDWRIHHLHLSEKVEPDGFASRTRELLFAHFQSDRAYLIDIHKHGDWADESIIEVVARNWPDAGIVIKSSVGVRLINSSSSAERRQLRQAGMTAAALEFGGHVWSPTGFMTMAGTSRAAWKYAIYVRERLLQAEHVVLEDGDHELLAQWPVGAPAVPTLRDWHVGWTEHGWVLYESRTLVYFFLGI